MAEKLSVPYQGELATGVSVAVVHATDAAPEFTLADGMTLRVRTIILDAIKLDEKKDAFGNPVYVLKMQNVIDVRRKS